MDSQKSLAYNEIRLRERKHKIHESEIPTEHYCSLPLPTRLFQCNAYALFGAPAVRVPGQAMQIGEPDRWWLIGAQNGRLLLYALCVIQPFPGFQSRPSQQLPPATGTMAQMLEKQNSLEVLMTSLANDFFAGRAGEPATRAAAVELLNTLIPEPLRADYQSLTPDFFAWLED